MQNGEKPNVIASQLSSFFLFSGKSKAMAALDAARARNSLLTAMRKEEDNIAGSRPEFVPKPPSVIEKANTEASEKQTKTIKDGIYTTPTPTPAEDATWLEKAVSEVGEVWGFGEI